MSGTTWRHSVYPKRYMLPCLVFSQSHTDTSAFTHTTSVCAHSLGSGSASDFHRSQGLVAHSEKNSRKFSFSRKHGRKLELVSFSCRKTTKKNLTTVYRKLVLCRRDITHAQRTMNERTTTRASWAVPLASPTPTFHYTLDSVSLSYAMSVVFSFFLIWGTCRMRWFLIHCLAIQWIFLDDCRGWGVIGLVVFCF